MPRRTTRPVQRTTPRRAAARRPRPASAERADPLWDKLSQGVLLFDENGALAFANRAARELLGLEARSIGRSAEELLLDAAPGRESGRPLWQGRGARFETLVARRGGAEVPLRVERLRRPSGGVALLLTDLSSARRLEEALRRRERLALVGELLAGVAHEVRNPLAGISSSAQVLLGRFEPRDERTRFVRAILDEVNRLDRLITRLLQFVRPGQPRLTRGSLEPLLRRVLEMNEGFLAESRVETQVTISRQLPEVWFDADLLYQVLLNLVTNAVQAMPSGGRLGVTVRTVRRTVPPDGPGRRRADAGRSRGRKSPVLPAVQVRITDTGSGIPKELLPRLFDPFFTTKPSGTGLGLSICQSILQEHGGRIQIASRRGHGTTVLVELPIEKRQRERRGS